MKKCLTFAAIAALVLAASCAKNVDLAPTEVTQHAIGFSNYTPKSLTKADGTYAASTSLIADKKFAVYSYATANGTAFATNTVGTQFMNGVTVTYTNNENHGANNAYTPLRYWPSGDSPDWLTFWAYYPVEGTPNANNPTNGITYTAPSGTNGIGSFAFTAASTAATMVDFMVADVVNDKIYGASTGDHIAVNGEVPLVFRHQLTKIRFQFKTDNSNANTKVVLTDAKLYNVKTTGTLSTTYTAGATTTDWGNTAAIVDANSDNEGDVIYEIFLNQADINNQVLTTSFVGGENNSELFLMIPQTMIAKNESYPQKLVVTWDVKTFDTPANATNNGATATTVGSNGLLSITHNSAVLYLDECVTTDGGNTQANIDWAKNQFTTYRLTIGPKPILFTATVQDWASETFGYFNVN